MRCAVAAAFAALFVLTAPPAHAGHGELLARWHLDTAAGGYTPDDSGHAHDGEVNGGSSLVGGGRFGNALALGGPGDSQVDVVDSAGLEPQRLTVLAWVKSSTLVGANKYVIGKGAADCDGSSYAITSGPNGGLVFSVLNGSTAYVSPAAGTAVWDGQWHAVAGTFDGATVRLWLDGTQVGTGTSAPVSITYGTQFDDLRIGNHPASNACGGGFVWPGLIDEVRIYDRALDADEIAHLHSAAHQQPPNLPPPPANTAAPAIDGAYSGLHPPDTLTGKPGSWTRSPSSYQWQWMRCDAQGNGCAEIGGATAATYRLAEADEGRTIRLRVRAVNAGGTSAPAFSAATPTVAKADPPQDVRITLTPRLTVSEPACSGLPVTLDASESFGPNPIVRYRFAYRQTRASVVTKGAYFGGTTDVIRHTSETVVVYDGPSPTAQHVFTPNGLKVTAAEPGTGAWTVVIKGVAPLREPASVYVEVWDSRGHRAGGEALVRTLPFPPGAAALTFANADTPDKTTRACRLRDALAPEVFGTAALNSIRVSGSTLSTTMRCMQKVACGGLLAVTQAPTRARRAAAQGRRRIVVIASASFSVPAGQARRVTARLTREGRRLLRRGRRVRARARLTEVGADGIPRTRARTIVLRRR